MSHFQPRLLVLEDRITDYSIELPGLKDSRLTINIPPPTPILKTMSFPDAPDEYMGHLTLPPATINLNEATTPTKQDSGNLDEAIQRIKERLTALREQIEKIRESLLAIQERTSKRQAEKFAKRRRDGVSRYFPPIDYLQQDLFNLQSDLQGAVEWNSDLREQVHALRFDLRLSCYRVDTCSNNSYENAPTREQVLADLQERERDLEKSGEHIVYLKQRVREAREERDWMIKIHNRDAQDLTRTTREFFTEIKEKEESIPNRDENGDVTYPEEEEEDEESDDSTWQYIPNSTPVDTPEDWPDQELFSEEEEEDDDMTENEALAYRARYMQGYTEQQDNLRAANGNEAVHASPDRIRRDSRQRNNPPQQAPNGNSRPSGLSQAMDSSFVAYAAGPSTHTANLLMLLSPTGRGNQQSREEEREQQPQDGQAGNSDDGDDGDDGRDEDPAPSEEQPTIYTMGSYIDPHFATKEYPWVISHREGKGDGMSVEQISFYKN